jgi:hydrogenase maturation protease
MMPPDRRSAVLVACIGNDLVADDAAGYEVYRILLTLDLPAEARIDFIGVAGLDLLDRLRGDERALIIVDAVQFGSPPGTIHRMDWNRIPEWDNPSISVHTIGLKETIAIGRILYPEKIPPSVLLVGIEGRCFNRTRDAMTPAMAAALPKAAECIRDELITLLEESLT